LQKIAIEQLSLQLGPNFVAWVVSAVMGSVVTVYSTSNGVPGVGFEDRIVPHGQDFADFTVAQSLVVAQMQDPFHVQVPDLLVDPNLLPFCLALALFGRRPLEFGERLVDQLDIVLECHALFSQLFVKKFLFFPRKHLI